MKVPVLQGAYSDSAAAYRTSYPINLEPTLVESGLSKGYLTIAPGVRFMGRGPGADRGAINWNGTCYRVMGTKLCSVGQDGNVISLGDVGNNGLDVTMDYSFDRLAIASNGGLYYFQPSTGVTQVTDPDLGVALCVLWIDGYFMTTDGVSLVVTELSDPYSVDPLKYGSAESDPDPVVALCKVRGEVYALNRYTIQNFQDVGGTGFPFSNNSGGLIPRGAVGTQAWSYFEETFAFVGSGRNEQLSVYAAGAGQTVCLSTSEVDKELNSLTVAQQALIKVESRVEDGEQRLYVHLPTKTLVYMRQASQANGEPVWYILADGTNADQRYAPRHMALCYGEWVVGDNLGNVGALDQTVETRFGDVIAWQFDTVLLYNETLGGILLKAELSGLPGRAPFSDKPTCSLSTTLNGVLWSQPRFISQGAFGERRKRVQWRPMKRFSEYMGLRFRGSSTGLASWAALDVEVEGLNV